MWLFLSLVFPYFPFSYLKIVCHYFYFFSFIFTISTCKTMQLYSYMSSTLLVKFHNLGLWGRKSQSIFLYFLRKGLRKCYCVESQRANHLCLVRQRWRHLTEYYKLLMIPHLLTMDDLPQWLHVDVKQKWRHIEPWGIPRSRADSGISHSRSIPGSISPLGRKRSSIKLCYLFPILRTDHCQ